MQKIWAEQSEPLNTIKRKQSVKKIREPLAEGKLEIVDNKAIQRSLRLTSGNFPRERRPPKNNRFKPQKTEMFI